MYRKWVVVLAALFLMFGAAEGAQRKQKADDKQAASKASAPSTGKVDINTASQSDLESVKGIGPATAKKIIAGRPYSSIDDLKKAGITAGRLDSLRASLTVSNSTAPPPAAAATKSSSKTSPAASTTDSTKKPSLWERMKGKKSADAGTGTTNSSSSTAPTSTSASTSNATSGSMTTAAPGGGSGKVWVNKDTKVFHREGDRWYGKTKNGEYMTEQEAVSAGYRPVKERKK